MHSSVTSSPLSSGRNGRNASSSAEVSRAVAGAGLAPASATDGIETKLKDAREVQVARPHDLNPIPLVLDDRGRDIDGPFQTLRQHVLGTSRAINHRGAAAAASLRHGLYCRVDCRNQHGGSKALPEMAVYLPWKSCAPQLIGARRGQRNYDARWRTRLVPKHEYAHHPLLHLPTGLANKLGAALQQYDITVYPEGIGSRHASGQTRQGGVDRCFQRTVYERSLAEQQATTWQELPCNSRDHCRAQQRTQATASARQRLSRSGAGKGAGIGRQVRVDVFSWGGFGSGGFGCGPLGGKYLAAQPPVAGVLLRRRRVPRGAGQPRWRHGRYGAQLRPRRDHCRIRGGNERGRQARLGRINPSQRRRRHVARRSDCGAGWRVLRRMDLPRENLGVIPAEQARACSENQAQRQQVADAGTDRAGEIQGRPAAFALQDRKSVV